MPVEILMFLLAGMALTFWIVRASLRHEERKLELKAAQAGGQEMAEANAQLVRDVARLKERVGVLERLVTDPDARLSSEIEKLKQTERASA
ncbi:hypothetical protein GC169_02005 [bacterium]|nr:hypothetical protein [bacterium]